MDDAAMWSKALMPESDSADGFTVAEDGAHRAELARLATLDPIAYDQQRGNAADMFGIRLSTLDDAVQALRPTPDVATGRGVSLPDVDPWPSPVSTSELLDAMVAAVARHVILRPPAANEGGLRPQVPSANVVCLPLPDHRHRRGASQCPPGGWQAGETQLRSHHAFDPPMILLDDVVQVFALPQPREAP